MTKVTVYEIHNYSYKPNYRPLSRGLNAHQMHVTGEGELSVKKFILLLVPSLLATTLFAHGQALDAQSICNLVSPESAHVFDWTTWRATKITDGNLMMEPLHWDASRDVWRGYDAAKPFDQPDDAHKRWSISLTDQQALYILQSKTTPDTDYVYVFVTTKPSAGSNGDHYGAHPCLAFAADAALVNDWIQRAYHSH